MFEGDDERGKFFMKFNNNFYTKETKKKKITQQPP